LGDYLKRKFDNIQKLVNVSMLFQVRAAVVKTRPAICQEMNAPLMGKESMNLVP